jgi:hypothetical protein
MKPFFSGVGSNQINLVGIEMNLLNGPLFSSEGYSSPDSTPCPSHILNAVNSQKELTPIRPSGPLANLFAQVMQEWG